MTPSCLAREAPAGLMKRPWSPLDKDQHFALEGTAVRTTMFVRKMRTMMTVMMWC